MDSTSALMSGLLGIIEGLTEFIPVSSTGHLLLAGRFLGFEGPRGFEFMIQLGAVLAILVVYFGRLVSVVRRIPTDPQARRFVWSVLIAFIPAAIAGVLLHDWIETVLFESPRLIAISLIVGGVILIIVDYLPLKPRYDDAMRFPIWLSFVIGLFQCLSLVPGVSRSGATIVGSLLLGTSKRAATEFSFFLSLPIMFGAFAFDLLKNGQAIDSSGFLEIAIAFVVAFIVALWVVRHLLDFVATRGFAIFGWWRILVGSAALVALHYS
ncbi:MAG: undecaprenyl-diphosphate phosphatase [Deltaproteobacteria bacterium]